MNAERLHTIAKRLQDEIAAPKLVNMITQLVSQVEAAINGPNEASQRAVDTTLKQLTEQLQTAASNNFSPGMRSVLEDLTISNRIKADALVGTGLIEQVKEALSEGYTSVQSLDRLRQLAKDVQALSTALNNLVNGFTGLGVESDMLQPGESVVGMTIPRVAIEDGYRYLQAEIRFFGTLIGDLQECLEGRHDDVKIHSIYSSDLGIDFFTSLQVTAQFASIVMAIKTLLEKLVEYRKIKEKAAELGLGKEVVESIEKKASNALEEKLNEIEAEVFHNCKVDEAGRVNELKSSVKIKLRGLAAKLERGFAFEARTGDLPEGTAEEQQPLVTNIRAFTTVRFQPLEGASILQLPEAEESDEQEAFEEVKPAPKAKKKRAKS